MTKVLLLLLVPKASQEKTLFHRNFAMKFAPCMYALSKNHNSGKKLECCTLSKWRPNNQFYFASFRFWPKFDKTTFPMEFFNEIWPKVGEHE